MKKIFIDGSAGTTGLRIADRLAERNDIELIKLSEDKRKDPEARKEALNRCDVAFLCLPDPAAIEIKSQQATICPCLAVEHAQRNLARRGIDG